MCRRIAACQPPWRRLQRRHRECGVTDAPRSAGAGEVAQHPDSSGPGSRHAIRAPRAPTGRIGAPPRFAASRLRQQHDPLPGQPGLPSGQQHPCPVVSEKENHTYRDVSVPGSRNANGRGALRGNGSEAGCKALRTGRSLGSDAIGSSARAVRIEIAGSALSAFCPTATVAAAGQSIAQTQAGTAGPIRPGQVFAGHARPVGGVGLWTRSGGSSQW